MPTANIEINEAKRQKLDAHHQVSYIDADGQVKEGTQMDYQGGLSAAVRVRGLSFIKAAKLIVQHDQRISAEKCQETLIWLKNEKQALSKNEKNLKKLDLLALEQKLIVHLNEVLYQNVKSFKAVRIELENAENALNWKPRSNMKTTFDKGEWLIERTETPIQHLTTEQAEEWLAILSEQKPDWFLQLAGWEQNYLTQKIRAWQAIPDDIRPNLGEAMGVVPTTIRRYPGSANSYHTNISFYQNGEHHYTFKKIRSGVLAPFDMAKLEQKVRITYQNLCQLIVEDISNRQNEYKSGDINILLQTLYSAPFQPDAESNKAMEAAVTQLRNELKTKEGRLAFIQKHHLPLDGDSIPDIKLLYANRPVNSVRSLSRYWLKNDFIGQESQSAVTSIEALVLKRIAVEHHSVQAKVLSEAFRSYKLLSDKLQSKGMMSMLGDMVDNVGFAQTYPKANSALGLQCQNLDSEMAAYEQIIMGEVGIRIGSCVSGKDREEMITIIAAAQLEYFFKHGEFPPAPDENHKAERQEYYEYIAHHYLSGHGMKLAGENALGCDGLKNVHDVFGKEICSVIKQVAQEYYGIDIKVFDPILTTQKVAGLNKPKPADPNAYHLPLKRTVGTTIAFAGITALTGGVINPINLVGGAVLCNGLVDLGSAMKSRAFGNNRKLESVPVLPVNNANVILELPIIEDAPVPLVIKRKSSSENEPKLQKVSIGDDLSADEHVDSIRRLSK